MKRILWSLPVWLMLADMLYGFSANITKSWSLNQQELPKDGLPVAPQIAFDGLQVLANGGMILIIGFGLLVLLRLNRTELRGYAMPIGFQLMNTGNLPHFIKAKHVEFLHLSSKITAISFY